MFLRPAASEQVAHQHRRWRKWLFLSVEKLAKPAVCSWDHEVAVHQRLCRASQQLPAGGAETAESALSAPLQQLRQRRCSSHIDWLLFAAWKPSGHSDPTYWHDGDLQSRRGLEKILLDLKRSLHAGSSPVRLLHLLFS